MAFKIKKPMNVTSTIIRFKVKEGEDENGTGVSAMVFEYASAGWSKPDLFLSYANSKRDTPIRGKNRIVNKEQHRKSAPEWINVLVDKNTTMLLALDEDLEKYVSNLFTPAIKINQGCPVWDFVVSA